MKAPKFKKLFAQLPSLNQSQRLQVLAALHPAAGLDRIIAVIAEIRAPLRRCPDCSCEHCHRHGQANAMQPFRCRQCGRTFNDLTGTPLARLRLKDKWLDNMAALLNSRTVRDAARHLDVHRNTAFRWRHRFLHWVKRDVPQPLTGTVEADETFLLESQKGARKLDCILVARDRSGQTIDAVTGRGALSKAQLDRHLLPRLDRQALLVTDAHAAYRAFATAHGIAHAAAKADERVRTNGQAALHVQNVNAYHRRFKEWLARFHGVASWRLPNYLGWFRSLDGKQVTSVEQLLHIAIGFIHSLR